MSEVLGNKIPNRNLLSALFAINTAMGASACADYADVSRDRDNVRNDVDLLFTEPSTFNELPNGDVEFSLSYTNEGEEAIQHPYIIRLRLLDRYLGQDQAAGGWPNVVEGELLGPNESATLTGIITKEEQENGGKFLNVVLDPQDELRDSNPLNNKYETELPGSLIEPHCETQVDENWGNEALGRPVPDVDLLVEEHFPGMTVRWNDTSSTDDLIPYSEWPESWKQELREAFEEAWNWHESGTPELEPTEKPENLFYRHCVSDRCIDSVGYNTYFSVDDARRMYMQQVATRVAARAGEWFSWEDFNTNGSLDFLQRNGMEYVPSVRNSAVSFMNNPELLSMADFEGDSEAVVVMNDFFSDMTPIQTISFLKENRLIGQTAHDTVALVLAWSKRLVHVAGAPDSGNDQQSYWNYTGATPLSSVLYGTVSDDSDAVQIMGRTRQHWIHGCHGTGELLVHTLLPANIHTNQEIITIDGQRATGGHALNYFTTEQGYTFLSHNDDPYSKPVRSMSMCPEELMNPEEKLNEWFVAPGDADVTREAIGRGVAELDVERISGNLLRQYCGDLEENLTPSEGQVFSELRDHYTMEELEEAELWSRLEAQTDECGRF